MVSDLASSVVLPILQSAVTLVALTGVALIPPAAGDMLLLPISSATDGEVVNIVRDHGGSIVAVTRWGIVARGTRARLVGPLLSSGIVPIAAANAACGR